MTTYTPEEAPQPGSRARSREIGYADAMLDMYVMLSDGARYWQDHEVQAAEDGHMGLASVFGHVRSWVAWYAQYAEGAWRLHADDKPPLDPRSMAAVDMRHIPRHETGSFPAVQ